MEVFDSIDTNGDGVLSKEEFKQAVEKMHYVSLYCFSLVKNIDYSSHSTILTPSSSYITPSTVRLAQD